MLHFELIKYFFRQNNCHFISNLTKRVTQTVVEFRGHSNNIWHFFLSILDPTPMYHLVTLSTVEYTPHPFKVSRIIGMVPWELDSGLCCFSKTLGNLARH